MTVRIGVVVFPGSNCDRDTVHALAQAGAEPVELWHEEASLQGVAAVILPGGFAYGDYLRAGVIARRIAASSIKHSRFISDMNC